MAGMGIEPVPLNEDAEAYEVFLLENSPTILDDFSTFDPATFSTSKQVATPSTVFTAAELTAAGYTDLNEDVYVAVYQLSAQVGRGFGRIVALAA